MADMFHKPVSRLFFLALWFTLSLFTHTIVHAAQVTLTWDPNTPTPEGYQVFQRLEGQAYDYTVPVCFKPGDDPTQTTCTVDNLADETQYHFVVRAYAGSDISCDSNEISHSTGPTEPVTYTINTDAGSGGSIWPESANVNAGESQTFTITGIVGYHIEDVLVDGHTVGAVSTHTFNQVDEDHVISAVFSINNYVLSAYSEGNGTISPGGSIFVAHSGSQTYTITPDSGFSVADLLVDGISVGKRSSYTFNNVTAPHSIRAIFEPTSYVISATAGSNGAITPAGLINVSNGGSRSFTIAPDIGYRVADVLVDGESVGALPVYTFTRVSAGHTISANFVADAFTIEASANEGGSISPAGLVSVLGDTSRTFNVTADEGYLIEDLLVDGVSLGALDNHTFDRISTDHTINALFRAVNQAPAADAGPDQAVAEQALVSLNGLNSTDLDDGIATFEWRQVKGTPVELSALTEEIITFTAPDVDLNGEALEFELAVTDMGGNMATDTCIVNVTWVNEAPLAKAGLDQSVNEGSTVVLSASDSRDPDDGIEQYFWRQVQGPEVVLLNADSMSPSFSALDVGPQGASLAFELKVTDAGGLQDTDRCMVTVTWDNMEPLAGAGPDQEAQAGQTVVLDGSASMDPDGLELNYHWRQTDGPPVTLSDTTAESPRFTAPVDSIDGTMLTFELVVTDSGGLQGVDSCNVTLQTAVEPEDTAPPTVTIENPSKGWAVLFRGQYTITGSADDDQQVARVVWKNDRGGGGDANGTDQWWKTVRLYRGTNIITITVFDTAGNQQSKDIFIYRIKWR